MTVLPIRRGDDDGFPPAAWENPPDPLGMVECSDQIVDALNDLDRHPATFVRWPFEDLSRLTGPMAPGDVWYICARSGGGKTTFVGSCIMRWLEAGRRMYVLPLETRPKSFRTYLACMQAGIAPGDALSGQLRTRPDGEQARRVLKDLLNAQILEPTCSRLRVSGAEEITADTLERAFEEAADFRAEIVLIDHIDHVQTDDRGSDLYRQSTIVNRRLMKFAQRYGMVVVATSQLNLQVAYGDALARYQPPRDQDVYLGNFKRTVATGMIGLYRPLRGIKFGETEEDFIRLLREARKGTASPQDVLSVGQMGVVAMKLRNFGSREGERVFLPVDNGRVIEPVGLTRARDLTG